MKRQTPSLLPAPLPKANYKTQMTMPRMAQWKRVCRAQGPCTTTVTTMNHGEREKSRRRQGTQETTTTGVAIMVVCHRMCDYHHEHLEEDERPTTMVTTTGVLAQGEGCHYDTMTGSTAMVTTMQDRLQERLPTKRPTTSLDYVIRLTDRLRMLRSKFYTFFSQIHFSFCLSDASAIPPPPCFRV